MSENRKLAQSIARNDTINLVEVSKRYSYPLESLPNVAFGVGIYAQFFSATQQAPLPVSDWNTLPPVPAGSRWAQASGKTKKGIVTVHRYHLKNAEGVPILQADTYAKDGSSWKTIAISTPNPRQKDEGADDAMDVEDVGEEDEEEFDTVAGIVLPPGPYGVWSNKDEDGVDGAYRNLIVRGQLRIL